MKIEIKRVRTGWFFRIVARNGRTLCHSEVYTTKQACERTAYNLSKTRATLPVEYV